MPKIKVCDQKTVGVLVTRGPSTLMITRGTAPAAAAAGGGQ